MILVLENQKLLLKDIKLNPAPEYKPSETPKILSMVIKQVTDPAKDTNKIIDGCLDIQMANNKNEGPKQLLWNQIGEFTTNEFLFLKNDYFVQFFKVVNPEVTSNGGKKFYCGDEMTNFLKGDTVLKDPISSSSIRAEINKQLGIYKAQTAQKMNKFVTSSVSTYRYYPFVSKEVFKRLNTGKKRRRRVVKRRRFRRRI